MLSRPSLNNFDYDKVIDVWMGFKNNRRGLIDEVQGSEFLNIVRLKVFEAPSATYCLFSFEDLFNLDFIP